MDFPKLIEHKNMKVKLFNWMDYPSGKSAPNVEAFDSSEQRLWTIEPLGINPEADCYTDISTDGKTLKAFNFQGYNCIIDEKTGKILSKMFSK